MMKDYKNVESALHEAAKKTEVALDSYLGEKYAGDTVVADAMRYSTLGGGKRIRAYLTLAFCQLFGGEEKAAIPFAAAIECVHAYSLIHDDLPCMDDDDLRRGKPSCHKQFGEAEALLAGDALLTLAFEIAASNREVSDKSVRLAIAALAQEAGARGMVCGQVLDIGETVPDYEELKRIYLGKTSCLIYAACILGYYAATDCPDEKVVAAIRKYADGVGLAFQIHDDLLDVRSDTATLGKTVGSDEKNHKKTSLAFFSLEEAEQEEARLTKEATDAMKPFDGCESIVDLAEWMLTRMK